MFIGLVVVRAQDDLRASKGAAGVNRSIELRVNLAVMPVNDIFELQDQGRVFGKLQGRFEEGRPALAPGFLQQFFHLLGLFRLLLQRGAGRNRS